MNPLYILLMIPDKFLQMAQWFPWRELNLVGGRGPLTFTPHCAPLIQVNWSCTPSLQQTLNYTGLRKEPKWMAPTISGQVLSKEEIDPLQKVYHKEVY